MSIYLHELWNFAWHQQKAEVTPVIIEFGLHHIMIRWWYTHKYNQTWDINLTSTNPSANLCYFFCDKLDEKWTLAINLRQLYSINNSPQLSDVLGRTYSPSILHTAKTLGEIWNNNSPILTHDPKLMTTGELGHKLQLVNWELCLPSLLFLQHGRPVQRSHRCWCLSNSRSILPSLMCNTQRYLNRFTPGSSSLPTECEQSTVFWQRTMACDLEALTLILTASDSATDCPSACWGSQSDEANKTHPSAEGHLQVHCSIARLKWKYCYLQQQGSRWYLK